MEDVSGHDDEIRDMDIDDIPGLEDMQMPSDDESDDETTRKLYLHLLLHTDSGTLLFEHEHMIYILPMTSTGVVHDSGFLDILPLEHLYPFKRSWKIFQRIT